MDKLELWCEYPIRLTPLQRRIKKMGWEWVETKYSGHWRVGIQEAFIDLHSCNMGKRVRKVTLNPSDFDDFLALMIILESLFEPNELSRMKISRMDIAVDFNECFQDIYERLVVMGPSKIKIEEDVAKIDGIYFGKGAKVFVLYDKNKEQRIKNPSEPWVRLECRMTKDQIPVKEFYMLTQVGDFFSVHSLAKYFKNTELHFLKLKEPIQSGSCDGREQYTVLKTELNLLGMHRFKKRHNQSRNYDKLKERHMEKLHEPISLEIIVADGILSYFESWQSEAIKLPFHLDL